jgi:hypothetical protein
MRPGTPTLVAVTPAFHDETQVVVARKIYGARDVRFRAATA